MTTQPTQDPATKPLSDKQKQVLEEAVTKTVKQYGKTLKMLADEDTKTLDEQLQRIFSKIVIPAMSATAQSIFIGEYSLDREFEKFSNLTKALISHQVAETRGCVDCKKLRCENCERLWQT